MKNPIQKTVFSALCIAMGLLLPFLTAQIQTLGNMLLPMHFPILLCGLLCGWQYGAAAGAVTPLLRSVLFGMPKLYPSALGMAAELLTYGLVAGLLCKLLPKKRIASLYLSLAGAMVAGRLVWGAAQALLLGFNGESFSLSLFWSGAFLTAWPGILLQLILLPPTVLAIQKMQQNKK